LKAKTRVAQQIIRILKIGIDLEYDCRV